MFLIIFILFELFKYIYNSFSLISYYNSILSIIFNFYNIKLYKLILLNNIVIFITQFNIFK